MILNSNYSDFRITEHFSTSEFHCKDGSRVPTEYLANIVYIANVLERLRSLVGNPTITINSAYRSYKHNRLHGGAINSNHLRAQAVDITTQKYTSEELYNKMLHLIQNDMLPSGELVRYSTFVHYAPNFQLKYLPINETKF